MLLRLGALYAEKYMELAYFENEMYTSVLEQYEKDKAQDPATKRPALDNSRSQRYLTDATAIFYDLEKKFPKHPKLDEILFFIGFVELEGGNPEKGLRYLDRVVKQFPDSRKYDEALVYLGDHYFEKTNFKEAAARYRILLSKENSYLYHYARYKLAWCTLNLRTAYHLNSYIAIQFAIENLLDANYRVFASGIGAPGRNISLTVRGRF
jgi:tetratricopeptide (TPR) repeat protein